MIEVSKKWASTPAICKICGYKMQVVFETDVIVDGNTTSFKFPKDFACTNCESTEILWADFQNESV